MKLMNQRMKYNLQHFAGKVDTNKGGKGDDDQDDEEDEEDEENDEEDESSKKKSKKSVKTFTQEELDAAIERRLIRERKKAEKAKEREEAEKNKTPEDKAKEKDNKNDDRIAALEAKIVCLEHGVEKENIKDVVTLAKNYVDEDTDFEEALEKVLKKYPHFAGKKEDEENDIEDDKKKKQQYKPKNGSKEKTLNPWAKETFNLTKQGELIKEDPAIAKELAASAGFTLVI